jgi:hypothetical protein
METVWLVWVVGFVFAVMGKAEPAIILSGVPWWHRVIGAAAAVAFYGAHLGFVK